MTLAKTIFSAEPKHLGDLDASDGVRLIRDLLWCEATRIGLPRHKIVISLSATVKDGGIDAKVEDVPRADTLLINEDSFFQIKTGATFKPWQFGDLKKELFGKSNVKPSKRLLGEAVRRCLDHGGRYVLITLGHDLLPLQHDQAREFLKNLLAACGYSNPSVEVIGNGQVLGYMAHLPSLCLEINGRGNSVLQTVDTWSQRADMQVGLKLGETQGQFIEQVRASIRGSEYQHVRVIGEPGIGKTRLVLEAISAEDIRPSTIYVPNGEDLQRSPLFNELLKSDRDYVVTLVVDDCEEKNRASIWNALKGKPELKLITIDHGPDTSSDSSMRVLQFPPLPDEQITEIISEYIGKRSFLSNWAGWCGGSPRVAHAVGDNLKRNPEDILKPPATVPIWDRFVLGHKSRDSKDADQHLIVLRHLALFQRFGFGPPVEGEAKFISNLVAEADPSITWAKFQSIVQHHRNRRILQGRHTLFIVPKALHVHLWLSFWSHHGIDFDIEGLLTKLPSGLKHWFLQLFIYAHGTPVAKHVVKQLLSPTKGPFSRREFLISESGTRFLNYLAEADPKSTLNLLETTFGRWSLEELRAWHTGRQNIVWALEKIAVWKDLFPRAARLLVHLALAENTKSANNSEGTLKGLFVIGLGWAATEASPAERFPILEELVCSSDANRRALGLKLCREWLNTHGGIRIVGVEYQGLKPTVEFWRPKTYGEVYDCWRRVWRFLTSELSGWTPDERCLGASQLIQTTEELLYIPSIADEVLDTLFVLAEDTAIDRQELVQFVIRELRFRSDKLSKRVTSRLKELDTKLTGTSFWDRFSRYVLYTNWDENYSVKGGQTKELELPKKRVKRLVKELLKGDQPIKEYLPCLVSLEGHHLWKFGFEFAKKTKNGDLDDLILMTIAEAGTNAKSQFLGGYLAGIREMNRARWEQLLLRLMSDTSTRMIGVECIRRSGVSESVIQALLDLYKAGKISSGAFGGAIIGVRDSNISQMLIEQIIESLIYRKDERSLGICIEFVDGYFLREGNKHTLPEDLTFKLLTSQDFFDKDTDTMSGYHWHQIAQRFRELYPSRDLELFSIIVKNLHNLSSLRSMSYPSQIADEIAKAHPRKAWKIVTKFLRRTQSNRYYVLTWLGNDGGFENYPELGAIRHFDPGEVMSWVRLRTKERVRLILRALPKTLDPTEGGKLTQMFIEEFSDDEEITGSLILHFETGGWTGLESEYLARKRDKARKWLSETKSPRIQTWLGCYIEHLSDRIELAQIAEEREF